MAKINQRKIKKDYFEGLKYKEIATKNDITINQLKNIILKNKWKRNNRSFAQKGNKNAIGNKGGKGIEKGTKIALKTGEYENIFKDVLNEDELEFYNNSIFDKRKELEDELKLLKIRAKRMMVRINKIQNTDKDLYIAQIEKRNTQTSKTIGKNNEVETKTIAENKNEALQKLEDGLTRIQEAIRRCVDSINKIDMDELSKNSDQNTGKDSLADVIQKAYEGKAGDQ